MPVEPRTREAALQAVLLNPDDPLALNLMSEFYFEPWSSKWKNLATHATGTDLLY